MTPEEFTQGVGETVGAGSWKPEVIGELEKPLDPNRVRTRSGRGGGKFEYIAGHDVKRRATQIFGFGNWGHKVVGGPELLSAVEIENNQGKGGWHVAFTCTVEVWVRRQDGTNYVTQGVGYGDGNEYGPAARATACELAVKEAETDALKRALTDLGDQFGLILYAKVDEKKRIERDANVDASQPSRRVERAENALPKNWAELGKRFIEGALVDGWWLAHAIQAKFGKPRTELTVDEGKEAFQMLSTAYARLADLPPEEGRPDFVGPSRKRLQDLFASVLDGQVLDGPPWRLSPDEKDRPTREEYEAEQQKQAEAEAKEVEQIGFGV